MKRIRPADMAWAYLKGFVRDIRHYQLPDRVRSIVERQQRRNRRYVEWEKRHAQYREDERRRIRESLKTLGLSSNIHDWPPRN